MFTAHLYNEQSQTLTLLDRVGLLGCAPSGAERDAKAALAGAGGIIARGATQCRPGEFVWVDLTSPDEADFALLEERFGVHSLVIEDMREQEGRPKLHEYPDHLYLIMQAVARDPEHDKHFVVQLTEVDCLVGADYVVTLHERPVPALKELHVRWTRHPTLCQAGPAILLYELMDEVLDDYFPLLDELDGSLDTLEERLMDGDSSSLSSEIFALKRALVAVRHVAGPTRDVVNTLLRRDAEVGARHFAYFQDLYDHAVRIVDTVDTLRDLLSGVMDVYLASQGNRLNEVMKTMTAMSIILLVPNLIAAIYGMNFENMPELRERYGYYGALTLMFLLVTALIVNFRRKKWL